ncbi:MAG: helicase, partial [Sphingobium phenoxybenzoativorans]
LPLPPAGAVILPAGDRAVEMGARIAGFRAFGAQQLRIDIAERVARASHEAIAKGQPFTAADPQVVSLGVLEPAFLQLMRAAGFRPVTPPAKAEGEGEEAAPQGANWAFRGRRKAKPPEAQKDAHRKGGPRQKDGGPRQKAAPTATSGGNQAFAGLAALLERGG